ncbi:hypothetical protein [Ralstonia wenshanensis]|uniref:hypothetical protein n=1 Tax=Ralstonia wenshanensis TaxID=2842456 RepID=UPI0039C69E2F
MITSPSATYKGFDLYPLVYRTETVPSWPRTRLERTFNACVVICRAGHPPGTEHSRVFRMTPTAWGNVGTARRGVLKFGEDVINGLVPGESVASL